jgi:hypothetical protein
MADVFGNIGNEQVELNNAATEATLKLLLQSSLSANKQSIESINKIALRAGVDENTVKQTNQRIGAFGQAAMSTGAAWAGLSVATTDLQKAFRGTLDMAKELTSGATEASNVLNIMSRMGGPLGAVFSGMSMLASFQEGLLKSYQGLTQSGVNFGGSLTDLRLAASQSYMTLGKFSEMMSQNSDTLARMGGTANDGAKSFVTLSKAINSSKVGDDLRALGFTTDQVNQGMLSYIATTGGRSKAELANVESIKKETAAYLEQLDRLASITGKNREEAEKVHKQAMFEADVQVTMSRMTKEDRVAFSAAMKEAGALHGQAGRDIVLAQAQGRAVTGEAGRMLLAVAPGAAQAVQGLQSTAKQFGASSREFADVSNKSVLEAQRAFKGIDPAIVSTNKQLGVLGDSFKTAAATEMAGVDSQEAFDKREEDLAEKRAAQKISEASDAAQAQKKLNELGQAILERVMPAFATLLGYLNPVIQAVADFLIPLIAMPGVMEGVLTSVAAVTAGFIALKMVQAAQAARELARTGGRKLGTPGAPMIVQDVSGASGGRKLGTPGAPMIVQDVSGASGGSTKNTKGTKDTKGPSKMGGLVKGLAGGVGGVLGGLALGAASNYAKEKGMEKTGAGLDIGSSALTGAGTGAMLGSIVPGVGTAIGGALGGLAGGAYGLYQNFGTLFGGKGNDLAKPGAAAEVNAAAMGLPPVTDGSRSMLPFEDPIEKLVIHMERLNIQTSDMVRYLKETAEQTRRTVDATKQLSGNLFPT